MTGATLVTIVIMMPTTEEGKDEERYSDEGSEFGDELSLEEGRPQDGTGRLPLLQESGGTPQIGSTQQQKMLEQGRPPLMEMQSRTSPAQREKSDPLEPRTAKPPPPLGGPRIKKNLKKNEKFQDVERTGQWGTISRNEKIFAAFVVIAVIGGVVAAVVLLTGSKGSKAAATTSPPTLSPSKQPEIDSKAQFPVIIDAMMAVNDSNVAFFPPDIGFFTPELINDKSKFPPHRAMAWILHEDPYDASPDNPWLILRFALASFYYTLNGDAWTNKRNWLTEESACNWHGISCDTTSEFLYEIDLAKNNLTGRIPLELGLFPELRSLVLTSNHLVGTIPADVLGNIPELSILFLNDNKLSGDLAQLSSLNSNNFLCKLEKIEIASDRYLKTDTILNPIYNCSATMVIHQNNITGFWPRNFCPRSGDPPVFTTFTLDCFNTTRCLCCDGNNCY